MLPTALVADAERSEFLLRHGYSVGLPMLRAFDEIAALEIRAVPARSWVYEREPIVTITGPSFVVSWLEPLVLRLFYPIQLATICATTPEEELDTKLLYCTCAEQAEIAIRVMDAVYGPGSAKRHLVPVLEDSYVASVEQVAERLLSLLKDPSRIFEVGMRSATCEQQHRLCLEALRKLGIEKTSNVEAARDLCMRPVGTMGHEHVQRWGSDLDAYRAMRDMRIGVPTYLLDTFDTITSGIPAVVQVLREHQHECSIRYDSGDKFGQYVYAHGEFQRLGFEPTHVIEDSLDYDATARFELLREHHTKLPSSKQVYGYGGHLVHGAWPNPITRDRVSAVYKLSETSGEPRMKFGNEAGLGKTSVPGRPVAWRRLRGSGPVSVVAQLGEEVPEDYVLLNSASVEGRYQIKLCRADEHRPDKVPHVLSPATQALVNALRARHSARTL